MSDVVCFHHAGCADGWCSAWLVRQAFPGAHLVPQKYGNGLPAEELYAGKRVFVVDFSYPPAELKVMAEAAESVVVLDHHASAIERWKDEWGGGDQCGECDDGWADNVRIRFDVRMSGAGLTWMWFHGSDTPPWIVRYVQDRDLWKWEMPDSHEVNAYIRTQPMTVEAWDDLSHMLSSIEGRLTADSIGRAILQRERQIIDKAVRNAFEMAFAGYIVPVVNTTEMISEIGNELCKGKPFAAMYQDDLKRRKRVWSLRSCDGGEDVSKIAMRFGGGGHRHAAGCTTDLT